MLTQPWQRITERWKALIEQPISADELRALMDYASTPFFGFYFMLALSVVIATLGLLSNSAPAIIGAMIVAPLMAPIISLSFGIVDVDRPLMVRSLVSVVSGVVLVIALAYASTMIIGLRIAGSEILGRASPTLLDMGIAVAAGAAAAFSYTRRGITNSIAGVAIAVALVPPLAVTGIGLAQGHTVGADIGVSLGMIGLSEGGQGIAAGAFLLFLTNFVGIVVVAGVVFLGTGYGQWQKAAIGLTAVAAVSLFLFHPLGLSLERLYVKSKTLSLIAQLQQSNPELFTGEIRLRKFSVQKVEDVVHVKLDAIGPRKLQATMNDRVDTFQKYFLRSLGRPVVVELDLALVDVVNYRAGSKSAQQAVRAGK